MFWIEDQIIAVIITGKDFLSGIEIFKCNLVCLRNRNE